MLHPAHEQGPRAEQILTPVLAAHPDHPRANLYLAMALAKTEPLHARVYEKKEALLDPDPERRKQAEALHRVLMSHAPAG